MVAAPFATLILGQLGADVIKVEPPFGDSGRHRKSVFMAMNCGKRSIVLNLKDSRSRPVWEALVASADVVVQNLDPRATASLDVGYEACRSLNPDIVYCHIKAFGPGPYAGRPATNPIVEALVGLMSITFAEGRRTRQGGYFYDQLAGAFAALGVVNALAHDDRRNSEGFVEVDLFETGLFSASDRIAEFFDTGQLAREVWAAVPYDTFQTADQRWIFLGVLNDAFWCAFCDAMHLDAVRDDPRFSTGTGRLALKKEVEHIAASAIGKLTLKEALARLESGGIPCAPVNTFGDVVADPHVTFPGKLDDVSFDGTRAKL